MAIFPPLSDFVILVLASAQAIEIWRHGSIMAPLRMRVDLGMPLPLVPVRLANHTYQLLKCMFCLSVWVAAIVYMMFHVAQILHIEPTTPAGPFRIAGEIGQFVGQLMLVPIMALAISRATNLLNDLTYPFSRTPNRQRESEVEGESQE